MSAEEKKKETIRLGMKICILHRYPEKDIKQTNASFPYMVDELRKRHDVYVKTFKKFDRTRGKLLKSILWIFYAPMLVIGRGYDLIYCDDSLPFYPLLVKLVSPRSKIILRLGDLHLMYYCSGLLYKMLHVIEKFQWSMMDLILPITSAMLMKIDNEKVCPITMKVVADPIDLNDFPFNPEHDKWYDVAFHGSISKHKGINMIFMAAAMLPEVSFCIFGDCKGRQRIEAKATKNVHMVGWKDYKSIASYLSSAKVGIAMRDKNPGNNYVITQAFLQYAAVGTPVLVSERFCMEGYPGQFYTVKELTHKIRKLLEEESIAAELIKNNRRLVETKHDARDIAREIVEIIETYG